MDKAHGTRDGGNHGDHKQMMLIEGRPVSDGVGQLQGVSMVDSQVIHQPPGTALTGGAHRFQYDRSKVIHRPVRDNSNLGPAVIIFLLSSPCWVFNQGTINFG
jgi:hypothetical protein